MATFNVGRLAAPLLKLVLLLIHWSLALLIPLKQAKVLCITCLFLRSKIIC